MAIFALSAKARNHQGLDTAESSEIILGLYYKQLSQGFFNKGLPKNSSKRKNGSPHADPPLDLEL